MFLEYSQAARYADLSGEWGICNASVAEFLKLQISFSSKSINNLYRICVQKIAIYYHVLIHNKNGCQVAV